jgi:predicted RNA binding protein YcfA (HicA-like mRNA interferase family)
VDRRKLLRRLAEGALSNVRFRDMISLAEGFGFRVVRTSESHNILQHPGLSESVNLQEVCGEAKPYQIRQFLKLAERHSLALEDEG